MPKKINLKNKQNTLVSVIIPIFNEKKTISIIIDQIRKCGVENIEIIAVDDKSTDGTRKILQKLKKEKQIDKLFLRKQNGGKAAAIKDGFALVKGDIVLIQDADLEYDPNEYLKLIKPITSGRADVVYGSRFKGAGPHRVVYFWHYVANNWLTLLSNLFTGLNLTDMETGYKVFTRKILKKLDIQEEKFAIEPEITARIAAIRPLPRIYEVGISYHGRTYEEGKKIGWRDAIDAVFVIFKYGIKFRFLSKILKLTAFFKQNNEKVVKK